MATTTITFVKHVTISGNRTIHITVPPEIPVGEAIITVTIELENTGQNRINRIGELFGQGHDQIWMADDFDAPLDGFQDYICNAV